MTRIKPQANLTSFRLSTELLNRLATQRASCKHWCALLTTAILLAGAIAKLPLTSLLWAAAPIFLLGLTEASYAGQEARYADAMTRRKGDQRQGDVEYLPPEVAGDSLVRLVRAALAPAIWPFYLGMFAIVSFGAVSINEPVRPVIASARSGSCGSNGCGSGGGCGSSGGMCGGSSSGKGCGAGCGSSSTAAKTAATVNRPTAVPSSAPRPGFVPVNSVQVNRPVNTAQPGITISPQSARPSVAAPIPAKVVPVSPQPVRNAVGGDASAPGGTATRADGVSSGTPGGSTPATPAVQTANPTPSIRPALPAAPPQSPPPSDNKP